MLDFAVDHRNEHRKAVRCFFTRFFGIDFSRYKLGVSDDIRVTQICELTVYVFGSVIEHTLNIKKDNVHRNMHAEYCDRPYTWDKDFEGDGSKVLVLGNSFARDWANILYEYDERLNISYKYYNPDENDLVEIRSRADKEDYVFFASDSNLSEIPKGIKDCVSAEKLYVIGNKNYGASNGIIYAHRWDDDYFEQTIEISKELIKQDREMSERYGIHFISMMAPVTNDRRVRVFTDDKKFISQDCRHLTQMGAQYYARILDLEWIER